MFDSKPDGEVRYIEKCGRTRKAEWTKCLGCEKWFAGRLKKGAVPKYCTVPCMKESLKRERTLCLKCDFCGKDFEKTKGKLSNRQTKTDYVFCTRKCKDNAQRLTSKFIELRPSHYGTGVFNYRATAGVTTGRCVDCNISSPGFLQVHHKDGNRDNNVPGNLEIVCFNHHAVRHMRQEKSGSWSYSSHALTPREVIPTLIAELGL